MLDHTLYKDEELGCNLSDPHELRIDIYKRMTLLQINGGENLSIC